MSPLPRKPQTILLADDEPYNLGWVAEFLESKGYRMEMVDTVDRALERLHAVQFRAVIADLGIPMISGYQALKGRDPLFAKYPGLMIADYARNHGHLDRQVIVYSVHDDALVAAVTARIGCTYLLKGRPRHFKDELEEVLAYDPLAKGK
jgi:CheY-like chemotaxis protein